MFSECKSTPGPRSVAPSPSLEPELTFTQMRHGSWPSPSQGSPTLADSSPTAPMTIHNDIRTINRTEGIEEDKRRIGRF